MTAAQAGKGDRPRPVNKAIYDANFTRVFTSLKHHRGPKRKRLNAPPTPHKP